MSVNVSQRAKVAGSLLKKNKKEKAETCGAILVELPDGSRFQCFTDGAFAAMLTDNGALPNLPQGDPTHERVFDYSKKFDHFESQLQDKREYDICFDTLSIMFTAQKMLNKKSDVRSELTIEVDGHIYNAKYVYDCIAILGGDVVFYQDNSKSYKPAILESEYGKIILMPLREK